jgi:threonine dehydratase
MTGARFEDSMDAARAHVEEAGALFVHPFEDEAVIAGQGTLGLELADQLRDVATVVVPIGGGGLCSGIALALKAVRPEVDVVGVQAASCLPGGSGFTIADGIAVKAPGEFTMSILGPLLTALVSVSDEEISTAIVLLLERAKLVVEGAGAVGVAALLAGKVPGDGPVAILLSGGNIDATLLISVMRHGLTHAGRYVVIRTRVPDRPGELVRLLEHVAEQRVNVVSVEHHREGMAVSVAETEVELTLTTRDAEHCAEVLAALEGWGYPVERLR